MDVRGRITLTAHMRNAKCSLLRLEHGDQRFVAIRPAHNVKFWWRTRWRRDDQARLQMPGTFVHTKPPQTVAQIRTHRNDFTEESQIQTCGNRSAFDIEQRDSRFFYKLSLYDKDKQFCAACR